MNRKIKILFVRPWVSSFIQNDLELLRKHFDVGVVDFVLNRKNLKVTLATVFSMVKGLIWADLTYSWFAGDHAFWAVRLSKIFKKKAIVVVGGYEVAKVPEIGYGSMLNPKYACRVEYVLNNANKVLAVSEFNKEEILRYTNSKNVELVYNGVNCDKFKPKKEKEDLVIMAGNSTKDTYKLKGIDAFVKASSAFPELKFVVIGKCDVAICNELKQKAPNVEFTGALSHGEVCSLFEKAKIYCQLSYRESFGISLAEAMSCGCIPVVTDRGAIPEVVGNIGFYVPYDNSEATIKAIREALKSDKDKEARGRIENMFAIKKRERELIRIINGI